MRLVAASSPHIRNADDVRITMGDVIFMMVPLLIVAVFYYGGRAFTLTAISVVSCVVFEYLYQRIFSRAHGVSDFTVIITGFFIAFNMPVTAPLWFPVAGAFFAVIIVKQLFGGVGRNVFNPAAAAIAFLTVTWPGTMSVFSLPFNGTPLFATPHGFETGRAALVSLKAHLLPDNSKLEMLLGNQPGNMGTVFIIGIVICFLWLLYRRIVNWQIPVAFVGTVALFALLFPRCPSGRLDSVYYELTSGALLFAAVFMATDPVTSPVSGFGRFVYGLGCGLFTVLLRTYGSYPDGVYFAILLMNPFVLALDRLAWHLKVKGGKLLYAKE